MAEFNERLKILRTKTKLSQYEFSKKLSLNRATYARYETGDTEPDYETLQKIADFFDVSVDYLFGRTDDPSTLTQKLDRMADPMQQMARKKGIELDEDELLMLETYRALKKKQQEEGNNEAKKSDSEE